MDFLNNVISELSEYKKLENSVIKGRPSAATGLTGVHKANVVTALCSRLKKKALIIVGDEQEGTQLVNDICSMGLRALFYPLRDFCFREMSGISREYEHKRITALATVLKGECDIVVATIDAASQFTMPPEVLKKSSFLLKVGEKAVISDIAAVLEASGYERCELVEGEGQYAVRGGILDLFITDEKAPVRVEFWDDEIDTINYFDTLSQRRTDYVDEIEISPSAEMLIRDKNELAEKIRQKAKALRSKNSAKAKSLLLSESEQIETGNMPTSVDKFLTLIYDRQTTLFDYFGRDDLIFVCEHTKVKERMHGYTWQFNEDLKDYLEEGTLCKGLDTFFRSYQEICSIITDNRSVYLDNFISGSYDTPIHELVNFTVKHLSLWGGSVKLLEEDLEPYVSLGYTCVILAGTDKACDSLREELSAKGYHVSPGTGVALSEKGVIYVLPGSLSAGIEYHQIKFALISQGHIRTSEKSVRSKRNKNSKQITNLAELTNGDYVVHSTYGIGQFQGIQQLEIDDIIKDYIKINYAKGDTLYVPVTQLDLVSKYIGHGDESTVKLNKLGSGDWAKTKSRVRKAVRDMADELIKLYSDRMHKKGYAFSGDNEWQHDFEARFEYEETADQLRCIDEIKSDMERVVPMDRLLCGDVGFGKTEVALRAAFKCIADSKQCVLLAPTTILAWQHYQTALRRFEGFPVNIELLSRFRTPKQQKEILKKLKTGAIDFIIGTHRLVQKDVEFRDLGLAIIDEEQRFGVAQKEKFKEMFHHVDILTLSATPIPRTLNMAMSGIRDMSVIEEAPLDRKPVQTYVLEHDKGVIAEAIRRELRRGGQVFYLYNRVESIEGKAAEIKKRIPEANVGIGHGKMTEQELSEVWRQMLEQEINVLVCTTIIETGVDLPNANTLIIENADFMGLSQLHQLRGRVGRSTRRAYAYFTYAPNKVLSEISTKRLTAIREFTQFGSGFKIALRDLEIRGAGNILGGQQHGHMEDVGYDMYIKMLNEAISEAQGETPAAADKDCFVDLSVQAHIPEKYISNLNLRLDAYRRISDIRCKEDAEDVIDELIDRYGDIPRAVMTLIDVALIRSVAIKCGIYEIRQNEDNILMYVESFENEMLAEFMKRNAKRTLLKLKAKPYIVMKKNPKENIIDLLKKTLQV